MTDKKLRIAFMGTPDFALEALKALCERTDHDIACVYSQPPRPKGRGHKVQPSPVHAYAEEHGIPVYTPKSLKGEAEQKEFESHNLDVAIVAAYGLILPKAVLDAPKFGCLNIHASLLPRWRGAAPIQYAILAGDTETGVTIMQMDVGLDTGPEISKRSVPISRETIAPQLHDELATLGADMIVETVNQIAKTGQPLPSTPQNDDFTYASMLSKQDGLLKWHESADQIDRQIRALNPWPGVSTDILGRRFKITKAVKADGIAGQGQMQPGKILNKQGDVVCGDGGIIRIEQIQPEGKKPMDFASALNGGYLAISDEFS